MRRAWAIGVVAIFLLAGAVIPRASGHAPLPAAHVYPTKIHHVVVIVFENTEVSGVLSKGPFFLYLARHYAFVQNDYAICHPSAPNYLALTSGATFSQCGSDTHHVFAATNIADSVGTAGLTWGAFQESMPTPCDTSNAYPYAVKHNPFVFYKDIAQNATRCKGHVLNLTAFSQSLLIGIVPNYAFITPNLKNDGHDTNVTFASQWLHGFLSPLVNKTSFATTAYVIVFDEGTTNQGAGTSHTGPTNSTGGGHIFLAFVSPLSVGIGNITSATNLSSHYSELTTVEWLLGVGSTGHHDSATAWPPLKAAFG